MFKWSFIMIAMVLFAGCASSGWQPAEKQRRESAYKLEQQSISVSESVAEFKKRDPGLNVFFREAYGYAVFPSVGKGAIGVGAAYGKGQVFERGRLIGLSSLTQVTIGFQLGGQAYSEIIFFKNKAALNDFKAGRLKFDAQASAVAATTGASANVAYSNGVAVFTYAKGGVMFEASLGGQKFSYKPIRQ